MRTDIWKNIISFFFVSTFLFLRIVDVHAFSHFSDDDQVHCELCEIITASNKLTPFTGSAFVEVEQKSIIDFPEYKTNFCYETSQYSITLPKSIYNKPPPTFLI
ncbi:hypothetical protein ATE84_0026 [Aquimarina sp. MAR_2010_214]|uniref:hypothetical protein n=1 Tax=Aquimarina sp. MAR_2010_214 TaxID=1250026 RepID=UPI000C714C4D|nr:hypothetical protein [Aquimarina sp. MAR_2010_214]PKV48043.1 hypothetical protein ATE84_0026 [Aquimarina sp. MAR_2010_214]